MKKLPISVQTFKRMREDNCVYVDKTEHVYNLAKENSSSFLSRPRRFGKSLLVNTFKELFSGKGGTYIAIAKAHLYFFKWLLVNKKQSVFPISKKGKLDGRNCYSQRSNG